ncbi:hypothetical protein TAMA11512_21200 [Selenomonas sp. TAMA-11512]|uniref:chromate transporter n=1 Tax=Selenomonas sp. TAMA-11512 TaxID=3095337 RepID=UPI0030904461|nr:hypothetical protein TAMA11512_21200 [Selenomonas sp. TAMA-11512]
MSDVPSEEKNPRFFWQLFSSTFLISAVTIGGGFVIIPILKAKYVDEYGWLEEYDALNLVSIAQSMPGVVAVNACILLGYRMAGLPGSITALLGSVLPPLFIIMAVAAFYDAFSTNSYVQMVLKGMQCGATALILKVAVELLMKEGKSRLLIPLLITVGTFIGNVVFDINIMALILIDGIIGLFLLRDAKYNG